MPLLKYRLAFAFELFFGFFKKHSLQFFVIMCVLVAGGPTSAPFEGAQEPVLAQSEKFVRLGLIFPWRNRVWSHCPNFRGADTPRHDDSIG